MTFPTRSIAASMFLLTTTLGCGTATPPAANQHGSGALLASAAVDPDADTRAAAAFDASTRATGELADALAAIDTAKRVIPPPNPPVRPPIPSPAPTAPARSSKATSNNPTSISLAKRYGSFLDQWRAALLRTVGRSDK